MAQRKKKGTGTPVRKTTENPDLPVDETEKNPPEEELRRDFFDDLLFHAANYIYVRKKIFISLAIAILVIIFSGYGTFRFIQYRENLRNEHLYGIEKVIYDTALSDNEQAEKALPLLDDFIAEYSDTEQYAIARFYRAGLYYKTGEFANAEQDLNDLLTSLEKGSDLYVLSSLSLANVLRDQDKATEALAILEQAKEETVTDIIMMEEAEIYMRNNENDKARKTLEDLLQYYPQSVYLTKAKQLLEIL